MIYGYTLYNKGMPGKHMKEQVFFLKSKTVG